MASIQNPYYVSGSGRSYGDGIASIAQALLSGPSPDEIAAREADMRYRDALGGKALAETDLLTDKRKALSGLGAVFQQVLSGDPAAVAQLAQSFGQGELMNALGPALLAVRANAPGTTDDQLTRSMVGAGKPLKTDEALTTTDRNAMLAAAEDAAFKRAKYLADSSAGASRYDSDRDYSARTDVARIGNEGEMARLREQGFIDARKPNILDPGQTILYNDAPAFGGAGTRQPVTARDLGAEGALAGKLAEIAADSAAPIPLNADQSLVTPTGDRLVTAPGALRAAIGEVAMDAGGRRLEGPPDPTGNGGKPPFEVDAKANDAINFAADDIETQYDGKLAPEDRQAFTARAAELYQQTRNLPAAIAQARKDVLGEQPQVENNWIADNRISPQRPIPGVNAADTAQYDGQAPAAGLVEPGNIDLAQRPIVNNPDGTYSTVRSASFNLDGVEVLLPTISDDGRPLSNQEAVQLYRRTGRHLGKFSSPEAATAYAQRLHEQQAAAYDSKAGQSAPVPPPEARAKGSIYQTPKGPMMWTGTGWKPAT